MIFKININQGDLKKMKIKKVLFSTITALTLVGSIGTNAFASEIKPAEKLNVQNVTASSAQYVNVKPAISKITGKTVANITLYYTKKIVNGRPQFDVISFQKTSVGDFSTNAYIESASGDQVTIHVDYNEYGIIDVGYTTVTFMP